MTRDFANKSRGGSSKTSAKKKPVNASRKSREPAGSPPWAWFFAGLLCGMFLSGLLWLAGQQPDSLDDTGPPVANSGEERPRPRFDFYTLLPEQSIDVQVDPEVVASVERNNDTFLLQAGSFKRPEDADRRRAELLLLGLDATVEEANTDNGRWYRVYVGPFESRSKLQSARSMTAQQGIDTLLLKRPGNSSE